MSDKINKQNRIVGSNENYTAPEYKKAAFHCPHCNVYAHQKSKEVILIEYNSLRKVLGFLDEDHPQYDEYEEYSREQALAEQGSIFRADCRTTDLLWFHSVVVLFCDHCRKYSIWVEQQMVYPDISKAPLPVDEMPKCVKELYNEAKVISNQSPRGACALLRLAIQFLVKKLGEDESNLNTAIANLVKKGLPEKTQKALDAVRVIGNNAVHPGEIDIKDDPEIVGSLFMLLNFICEKMITENKKVDTIYSSLPKGKIEAINKRDNRVDSKH